MIHSLVLPLFFCMSFAGLAQDGAGYDPHAKEYRAPELSLAGAKDTPEVMSAIALLSHGDVDKGVTALKRLADAGDVISDLLLGNIYRRKGNLPIPPNPAEALRYYRMASRAGSGEASELIAEMIEGKEVQVQPDGDAAAWRAVAAKQGWVEQKIEAICFDWFHGPDRLRCNSDISPRRDQAIPADISSRCPTDDEMALLWTQGITGVIEYDGGDWEGSNGVQARAILLVDHVIPSEEDLKQPLGTSVIYIQTPENRWRMLPSSAPLLDRFLVLTPENRVSGRMMISAQQVNDAEGQSTCSRFSK
jgi:hypothetical protein